MFVIEIFLPLAAKNGRRFPKAYFDMERSRLADRFGGLTMYSRAPAVGLWGDEGDAIADDIVVFEVMTDKIERAWWEVYRRDLALKFKQEEIVVRSVEAAAL